MRAKERYEVDAEGQRALNEAENLRSDASRRSALHRAWSRTCPRSSARASSRWRRSSRSGSCRWTACPASAACTQAAEAAGRRAGDGARPAGGEEASTPDNLAESVVNAALRYRAQAPFVDDLLKQIGITPHTLVNLGNLLKGSTTELKADPPAPEAEEHDDEPARSEPTEWLTFRDTERRLAVMTCWSLCAPFALAFVISGFGGERGDGRDRLRRSS